MTIEQQALALEQALKALSNAAATAVHFQHQDTNAMLELSSEVKRARAALAKYGLQITGVET